MDIILYILIGLFVVVMMVWAIYYVRSGKDTTIEKKHPDLQKYTQKNQNIFGVSDNGTSLNDKEIIYIEYDKLGLDEQKKENNND